MKRKTLIAACILVVAAIITLNCARRQPDWQFVRRVTGFDFPAGTEYLAQYDNAEWFVVSVVRIPENSASSFVRAHRFVTGGRREMIAALSLPEQYRVVPDRPDVLSASGQKEYQAWQALFDPRSRLMWIHVAYPDRAGDHPGTAPQPRNKASEPATTAVVPSA
jgi:hypothetical protein